MFSTVTVPELRRRATYPWDRWVDGKPRTAVKGVDFWCSPDSFGSACYAAARRMGMRCHVRVMHDSSVYFRFYGNA